MRTAEHLAEHAKLIAMRAIHYVGDPCGRCGETLRYLVNRTCVTCTRRKARAVTAAKRDRRRAEGIDALKRLGLR